MNLLYVAIFVIFIIGYLDANSLVVDDSNTVQSMRSADLMQTAQEGAAVYIACAKSSVAVGQYTAASFNIGVTAQTPLGNQWGCVKTAGGAFGGLITTVTFISAPTFAPGMPSGGIENSLVQKDLAYQISEDLSNLVQFQANTVVGTIEAGGTEMSLLAPAGQMLPILNAALSYSTPAIVGGLYSTTPTNNQTATSP